MAHRQVPRLQMAVVGVIVALVAMLPDRARRVRVLVLSGLVVWLYPAPSL